MIIYRCKLHGKPYTVCPACRHQYCEIYWLACPRCYEREHGHCYVTKLIANRAPFYPSSED